jgi:putative PIN family toxin of toxin-antitoxin system
VLVVLVDTNVWVSAFINPHGHPAKLKDAWLNQQFQVVVSVPLLDEIAEVLTRPRIRNKYRIDANEVSELLRLLSAQAIIVVPTGQLHLCRDPDDNLILETALLGQARYAISRDDDIKGDQELIAQMLVNTVTVLSVQHFLERLAAGLL